MEGQRVMEDIDPKLLKIVALAKAGVGGEKDTALAIVKQICERDGIDFDAVMSDTDMPREYIIDEYKVRSRDELQIAIQIVARFATTKEHPDVRGSYYSYDKTIRLRYTATAARHIDTLNALAVYLKAYRAEKRKFLRSLNSAFYSHHNLFSQFSEDTEDDKPLKEKTKQELEDEWRSVQMMQAMTEEVQIRKQLNGGESI
jgi:hypothetical protein